jgi:hypothetical protein
VDGAQVQSRGRIRTEMTMMSPLRREIELQRIEYETGERISSTRSPESSQEARSVEPEDEWL